MTLFITKSIRFLPYCSVHFIALPNDLIAGPMSDTGDAEPKEAEKLDNGK